MRWQTFNEGRWIFLVLVLLLLPGWWHPLAAIPGALLMVFSLWFFRDPERDLPGDENTVVAPADGVVTEVIEVAVPEADGVRMKRIGIFLSVFDVHVNRMPMSGRVVKSVEKTGEFLDARHPEAGSRNACRTWVFEGPVCGLFVVKQITGAIARRIVPWSVVGEDLERGHRFGMIRFGSRTELFLPMEAEILVGAGVKVRGASTAVARFPEKEVK